MDMGTAASLAEGRGDTKGKRTPWVDIAELLPFLEEGDLVQFDREYYQHWAVYIGPVEGSHRVVHLAGIDGDKEKGSGLGLKRRLEGRNERLDDDADGGGGGEARLRPAVSLSNIAHCVVNDTPDAEVKCDDILEVAKNSKCRVNNLEDSKFEPLPPSVVVDRATGALGTRKYNILFNNCEHFATWCRYGSKQSSQTSALKSIAVGVAGAALTGSVGVGVALGTGALILCKIGHQVRHRNSMFANVPW